MCTSKSNVNQLYSAVLLKKLFKSSDEEKISKQKQKQKQKKIR